MEELKYISVLLMSEGRVDRRPGEALAAVQMLYLSVIVKRELSMSKAVDLPLSLCSYPVYVCVVP